MTTIVWDGKALAADKLCCHSGHSMRVTKIRRLYDRDAKMVVLVGVTGAWDLGQELFGWVADGRRPEQYPDFQRQDETFVGLLVVEPGGRVLKYERSPVPMDFTETGPYCLGSGRDYAYGALHMGATAEQAVKAASAYDSGTGMGVDVLMLVDNCESAGVGSGEQKFVVTTMFSGGSGIGRI